MRKYSWLLYSCLFFMLSCGDKSASDREYAEEKGGELLQQARAAYKTGEFETAIQLIDSVRVAYPLAFEVREQGILLKDSVCLEEARTELNKQLEGGGSPQDIEELQTKITFYLRKLQHDIEQRRTHEVSKD